MDEVDNLWDVLADTREAVRRKHVQGFHILTIIHTEALFKTRKRCVRQVTWWLDAKNYAKPVKFALTMLLAILSMSASYIFEGVTGNLASGQ